MTLLVLVDYRFAQTTSTTASAGSKSVSLLQLLTKIMTTAAVVMMAAAAVGISADIATIAEQRSIGLPG